MNKEELAQLLNGREYGEEITKEECKVAWKSGLLVIFGASDDLVEFRGHFNDETDCYGGGVIWINNDGVLSVPEEDLEVLERYNVNVYESAKKFAALWDSDGYSWTFKIDIDHATFDIMDDGEKYCRGIIINVSDL